MVSMRESKWRLVKQLFCSVCYTSPCKAPMLQSTNVLLFLDAWTGWTVLWEQFMIQVSF